MVRQLVSQQEAGQSTAADVTKKEVEYKASVNKIAKTVTIPPTVKIDGVKYKVTRIDDNAFKDNKTVTIICW